MEASGTSLDQAYCEGRKDEREEWLPVLEALRGLVQNEGLDAFGYLDRGIGTKTASGQRWLAARAAIASVEGKS